MQNKENEVKGYGLFNDVEDATIQSYNRARVMMNILEDDTGKDGNPTLEATRLAFTYFSRIPENERIAVHQNLVKTLEDRKVVNGS